MNSLVSRLFQITAAMTVSLAGSAGDALHSASMDEGSGLGAHGGRAPQTSLARGQTRIRRWLMSSSSRHEGQEGEQPSEWRKRRRFVETRRRRTSQEDRRGRERDRRGREMLLTRTQARIMEVEAGRRQRRAAAAARLQRRQGRRNPSLCGGRVPAFCR